MLVYILSEYKWGTFFMRYIFLHGLGQDSSSWDHTISFLSRHRPIYCPDLPELLQQKEVTYNHLYASFVEYCAEIDEPLHLCGLSLGGILALNYAIKYPERVSSLVLIGVQHKMPKILLKFQNMIFRLIPNSAFQQMGFTKQDFIQLTNSMSTLNFSKGLHNISCKTLIVCGKNDHANKKASKELTALIPTAKLQFITKAGHEVNTQAPRELAEMIEAFYGGK